MKGGSKYMKIKVETATGKVKKIVNENETPAEPVDMKVVEQIYQAGGFKHVATILHAESSPGCVYYMIGGTCVRICS